MKATLEFLDKTLLSIKDESVFRSEDYIKEKRSDKEVQLYLRTWHKLEKDGFVYYKNTDTSTRIYISFEGLLALENTPFFFKNKPYQYLKFKMTSNDVWNFFKILAVGANALFILFFIYLTYIKLCQN